MKYGSVVNTQGQINSLRRPQPGTWRHLGDFCQQGNARLYWKDAASSQAEVDTETEVRAPDVDFSLVYSVYHGARADKFFVFAHVLRRIFENCNHCHIPRPFVDACLRVRWVGCDGVSANSKRSYISR